MVDCDLESFGDSNQSSLKRRIQPTFNPSLTHRMKCRLSRDGQMEAESVNEHLLQGAPNLWVKVLLVSRR